MSEWKEYKVEDFCEVIGGGTPSTKEASYYGGSFSWITPRDLTNHNNRFISKGERSITELGLRNSSARILPKNSILLTSRAPIGYIVIAENEVCTNQGFKSLIVNPEKADYNFVYYLIKSNIERIKGLGTGTTFAEISGSVVKNLKFYLPDLPTQNAIAEILSSLDDKIELNNKINQELENLAQTLFKRWFIDFEFPNENGEPYQSSGGEMVDSELGKIPKGWRLATLQEILDVKGGATPSTKEIKFWNGEYCWTSPRDLSNLKYPILIDTEKKITKLGLSKISSGLLPVGTLLLSSRAPIGYTAITNVETAINQGYIAINGKNGFSNLYLLYWLKSNMNLVVERANGSTFLEISKTNFKEIKTLVPDNKTLKEYSNQIEVLFSELKVNVLENSELTNLRDTLLPKLISGEIEVKQVLSQTT